jgi:DNA replication protein DnaC
LTEIVTKHCSLCNDTGWKIVDKDGREFAQKCECQTVEIYKTVGQKSNIPQRFLGYELNSYMPQDENPSQKKAKKVVRKFIDDFPSVKDQKGLLLQGPVGVGKTRLLCSIANALIIKFKAIDIYYIDWNDLVREMRSGESHATRDFFSINELINKLIAADLLLFDELGASKLSEWVQDNVYHIFNKRYNNQKLTVCATNYPDKPINNQETLAQRIGTRIRSRLYEMTEVYEIKGTDYRKRYY